MPRLLNSHWYSKKEIQVAIVTGVFLVIVALIALFNGGGRDIQVTTHGDQSPAVVTGDGGEVNINSDSKEEVAK